MRVHLSDFFQDCERTETVAVLECNDSILYIYYIIVAGLCDNYNLHRYFCVFPIKES